MNNTGSLTNRVALVTGATGNLGTAVVRKLLENGVRVVAAYRDERKFTLLTGSLGELAAALTGVKADVTDEKSVQNLTNEAIQAQGRIDFLLNLVGGYKGGADIFQTSEDDWNFLMSLNLKSAFNCAKAVLPHMMKKDYGRIVSVAARPAVEKRGRAKSGAYAVAKAGVAILTETIAEEIKKFNITANCVLPSTIDTPENRRDFPQADFAKWVTPDAVAGVILFLVSPEASITSGAAIPVYGKA